MTLKSPKCIWCPPSQWQVLLNMVLCASGHFQSTVSSTGAIVGALAQHQEALSCAYCTGTKVTSKHCASTQNPMGSAPAQKSTLGPALVQKSNRTLYQCNAKNRTDLCAKCIRCRPQTFIQA